MTSRRCEAMAMGPLGNRSPTSESLRYPQQSRGTRGTQVSMRSWLATHPAHRFLVPPP